MDAFRARLVSLRTVAARPSDALLFSDLTREKAAEFRGAWASLPLPTRRELVTAMLAVSEDQVEPHFGRALRVTMRDDDAVVRARSIEGLWEDEGEDLLRYLVDEGLADADRSVRLAAVRALARFSALAVEGKLSAGWYERLRDQLLRLLQSDESTELRRRALEAVAVYPDDAAVHEAIATAYASGAPEVRMSALFAMSQNLDARWLGLVRQALESPHDGIRFEAARAAGLLAHRGAVPRLTELLGDSDREVQLAAIQALGQIGGPDPVNILRRLAVSRDDVVREAAEAALEEAAFMTNPAVPARPRTRASEG